MLCPLLSNSKRIELTEHTSCYWDLGLTLCYLGASADANFRKVWYSLAPCETIKNFAHVCLTEANNS